MKTKVFLIFFLMFFSRAYADVPSELIQITDNFDKNCFEYSKQLNKDELKDNLLNGKYQTYKVNINSIKDLKIIQNGYLIPFKTLYSESNYINYSGDFSIVEKEANDNNRNTFKSIDTLDNSEIIFELDKLLLANTFELNFKYDAKQNYIDLYISSDGKKYFKVDKSNISDFDIKFVKLKIECSKDMCIREKIKLYELNFIEDRKIIVLNSFFDNDLQFYSNFNCTDKKYTSEAKYYDDYSISSETQNINLDLEKNPTYNIYTTKDFDKDEIVDELDNCPNTYNRDQKDSDASGIGDACSDKDKDSIIGEKDNCPTIYNPKQEDDDKNGVGNACEKDSDNDGVFDTVDNCLNVSNPNQEDDDNDKMGNACDNCKAKYNFDQKDVDKDGIGDTCDEKDDRYVESNKGFFIGLLICITIIFGVSIGFIIKKLK
ncbi:MAG: thrombospondin type 3 repeat-containing protein [Candidatus Gracilibacteria bacterium]|nr:thrombospondin type 3 repeat-containing protein [Candidatus Gracilibacteria bacterium]